MTCFGGLTQALSALNVLVPKQLRDAMVEAGWSIGRSPVHHVATSKDGTVKVLPSKFGLLFGESLVLLACITDLELSCSA